MNLKLVCLVLLSIVISWSAFSTPTFANHVFKDINLSHEAHNEINYIFEKGIIKGYEQPDGDYFKPSNAVTRAQAAKMLVIATGHAPLSKNSSFPDVPVGTEASGYIEKAVSLGYFAGFEDGTFGVNKILTRGQMSAILVKAFKLDTLKWSTSPNVFTDVSTKNQYLPSIKALYNNGISQGDGDQFKPIDSVKRSHFALFLARTMDEKFKVDGDVYGITIPNAKEVISRVVVTENDLNVRTAATTASSILGKVHAGEHLQVFEVSGDWLKIEFKDAFAYVHKAFTSFLDASGKPIGTELYKVKITATDLNARSLPSSTATKVGSFKLGNIVSIYGETGDWLLTKMNGIPVYIHKNYTEKIVQAPTFPPIANLGNLAGKVTIDELIIRSGPNTTFSSIAKLNRGTIVSVKEINGYWAKIMFDGKEGYTNKTYLKLLNQNDVGVKNRIIVIDAGHGMTDPGAVVKPDLEAYTEKSINLKVSLLVEAKLKAAGANVVMTRNSDTFPSLGDRVALAYKMYGEIFVSIHSNSHADSNVSGTETFYNVTTNDNSIESKDLGTKINTQIVNNANMKNRGVKENVLYVNRMMDIPSVLVELGFMSNPSDMNKLKDSKYLEIYASSIYNGIIQYYAAP